MRHLYRIAGRSGVDLVVAHTPIEALGLWEAHRGSRLPVDPKADTTECALVPDEQVVGPGAWTAGQLARVTYGFVVAEDVTPAEDVVLAMGGRRG